ncbi:unnamed protein product [Leuciscus chuanchicus]
MVLYLERQREAKPFPFVLELGMAGQFFETGKTLLVSSKLSSYLCISPIFPQLDERHLLGRLT